MERKANHIEDMSCTLCENRRGVSSSCCCPEDVTDLVVITEEKLRRRIALKANQKLCTIHASKLRNGLLFGGSSVFDCCAPFHIKTTKSPGLRPVPHTWKEYFLRSTSNDVRYRPRQRICWECYAVALEVINSEQLDSSDEESTSSHSSRSFDFGYISPRRWASNLSLFPASPRSSQFGSSSSLTPSLLSPRSATWSRSPRFDKELDETKLFPENNNRQTSQSFSNENAIDESVVSPSPQSDAFITECAVDSNHNVTHMNNQIKRDSRSIVQIDPSELDVPFNATTDSQSSDTMENVSGMQHGYDDFTDSTSVCTNIDSVTSFARNRNSTNKDCMTHVEDSSQSPENFIFVTKYIKFIHVDTPNISNQKQESSNQKPHEDGPGSGDEAEDMLDGSASKSQNLRTDKTRVPASHPASGCDKSETEENDQLMQSKPGDSCGSESRDVLSDVTITDASAVGNQSSENINSVTPKSTIGETNLRHERPKILLTPPVSFDSPDLVHTMEIEDEVDDKNSPTVIAHSNALSGDETVDSRVPSQLGRTEFKPPVEYNRKPVTLTHVDIIDENPLQDEITFRNKPFLSTERVSVYKSDESGTTDHHEKADQFIEQNDRATTDGNFSDDNGIQHVEIAVESLAKMTEHTTGVDDSFRFDPIIRVEVGVANESDDDAENRESEMIPEITQEFFDNESDSFRIMHNGAADIPRQRAEKRPIKDERMNENDNDTCEGDLGSTSASICLVNTPYEHLQKDFPITSDAGSALNYQTDSSFDEEDYGLRPIAEEPVEICDGADSHSSYESTKDIAEETINHRESGLHQEKLSINHPREIIDESSDQSSVKPLGEIASDGELPPLLYMHERRKVRFDDLITDKSIKAEEVSATQRVIPPRGNEDATTAPHSAEKTDLYKQLHGTKDTAGSSLPHELESDTAESRDHVSHLPNNSTSITEGDHENNAKLRTNQPRDCNDVQGLRRRTTNNRSHSVEFANSSNSEEQSIHPRPSIRSDAIIGNRKNVWNDKRRKFGVSFATPATANTTLQEEIPSRHHGQLLEDEPHDCTSTATDESSTITELFGGDPLDEILQRPRTLRESRRIPNKGRLVRQKSERELKEEGGIKPDNSEDDDVSAVLSDVLSSVCTAKTLSDWFKSFSESSMPMIVLAGISVTAVLSLSFVAFLAFVY